MPAFMLLQLSSGNISTANLNRASGVRISCETPASSKEINKMTAAQKKKYIMEGKK
jgi:hypothetical protein